ncbi:response regulator transcription factor [Faecalicatena contorta]|uniref:Stage 0 sporulation protein A homolog n=1 Tax=Faecalicatena contorta TaxID=39482 RepID=A0A315ZTD6_9FIRM|nr:response regulator [Faecalicatena contorta]PWJ48569.1 two-component system response regulator YesN [Faecalicatena contorta]SUQ15305.1 two-component system, response regulator YesN [Faecalicatena contorta]
MIKVIIADDEEKVCQLICKLINWEELDMNVSAIVHDGVEALEAIQKIKPDIVISDIRMPGYNGLELIKRAQEISDDIAFVIISGYQQFDYAKQAIQYGVKDYLLKPIKKKELCDVLKNIKKEYLSKCNRLTQEERNRITIQSNREKVRTTFFMEVLYKKGRTKDELTLEKINKEYYFNFKEGSFQAIVIKIDGLDESTKKSSTYIQDKFAQGIDRHIREICFECEKFFDDNYCTLILNYEPLQYKEIRRGLQNLLNDILLQKEIFENFQITFGLGVKKEKLEEIYLSLKTAIWATEQRILIGINRMIEGREISLNVMAESQVFYEFNKKLSAALENLNETQIKAAFEYLKTVLVGKEDATGHEIMQMCKEALNLYLFTMQKNNIKISDADSFFEECCKNIDNIGNVNEIFSFLVRKILGSMRRAVQDKKMLDNKPIRDAKYYIEENYNRSLTLEIVSNFVGFNSAYFSSLFKKETGVTFLEYLTDLRMSHARELLRETNMNVSSVCEAVGYSDVKYFTKNFKKVTGLKPNEYRKIYS